MMKMKIWIVFGIVAAVVLAAWYIGGSIQIEEGAPEMSISVLFERADGETAGGTIIIEDGAPAAQLVPMTTVDVGVPFVVPTSVYIMKFFVTVSATPQSPQVNEMTVAVFITGQTAAIGTYYGVNGVSPSLTLTSRLTPDTPQTLSFTDTGTTFRTIKDNGVATARNLLGSDIDGSQITFAANVQSIDYPEISGQTTVTANLQVGVGGDISVSIENISVAVA